MGYAFILKTGVLESTFNNILACKGVVFSLNVSTFLHLGLKNTEFFCWYGERILVSSMSYSCSLSPPMKFLLVISNGADEQLDESSAFLFNAAQT